MRVWPPISFWLTTGFACWDGAQEHSIPTLARTLGVWSGSNRLFEVAYMLGWYAGPTKGVESLDFMGSGSNLQLSRVLVYELSTILLFAVAVIGRKRRIRCCCDLWCPPSPPQLR